jgi:uncharacterized protein (TIGR02246 family)
MLKSEFYTIEAAGQSDRYQAQQLLNQLQQAINQRDWPLFRRCFTEDVLLINLLGQPLTGPDQLQSYQQLLIDQHQDRLWRYNLLDLRQLDLDSFLIHAEQQWQPKGRQHKVGLCSTPLYIVKRQGALWRICAGNTL